MQLQFDPMRDDDYVKAREIILEEFESWAARRSGVPEGWGADAALFLDWRVQYSTGELDRFTVADVEEYLLEWCPRKLSFAPADQPGVMEGVEAWVQYLAETGQWGGGLVRPILSACTSLRPRFLEAMANPANFGMAKSLFASPIFAEADLDFDDPDALRSAMEAFNNLPFDERRSITDGGLGGPPALSRTTVDLPLTPTPDRSRAETEARDSPIIVQLRAVAEYLTPGRVVTAKGNPKVTDARALAELFVTDDISESMEASGSKLRSADNLPHLMYLLDAAIEAGAVRRYGGKLVAVKSFRDREPLDRIEVMLAALVKIGPIFGRGVFEFDAEVAGTIEDGLFHWMVPAFVAGSYLVDDIVDEAVEVVPDLGYQRFGLAFDPVAHREQVAWRVEEALDIVERCGLVVRAGRREETKFGRTVQRGGTLLLTEIGRVLLPRWLATVGYRVRQVDSVAELAAPELLELIGRGTPLEPAEVFEAWNPGSDVATKSAAVAAAMEAVDGSFARVAGAELLAAAGPAGVEAAQVLVGTRLGGYALGLLSEERIVALAEKGHVGTVAVVAPLVDALAVELDFDPAAMVERFDEATDGLPVETIELLWRVDLPETIEVLQAIGKAHPDRVVAKAARKAVIQHRSRYPQRR